MIYWYIYIYIYIYCVCVYTHRYNILSNYVYYMNLHLENFNKLETRDRWTATVFTSSSSVVQIILTNSSRGGWHVTDTWLSDQSADIYVGHDFWLRKLNQCCSSNCLSLSLSLAAMSPRALMFVHKFFFGGSVTRPSTGALLEGNLQAKQVARGALFVGLNHEAEGFIPNFSQGCSDDARFVLVVLLCASLANLCICCRKIVLLDFRSLQILGKTCHWNMGRRWEKHIWKYVTVCPINANRFMMLWGCSFGSFTTCTAGNAWAGTPSEGFKNT